LADFSQHFGVGKNKRIILVLDRAGWHTSDQVIVPEGIHLLFLPPYSPELQPAERLWSLTNEPIANRSFKSLDEPEVVLSERCQRLLQQLDLISGLTFFHWWQACCCRA
jgi:transposase